MEIEVGRFCFSEVSKYNSRDEYVPTIGIVKEIAKCKCLNYDCVCRIYHIEWADGDEDWYTYNDMEYFEEQLKDYKNKYGKDIFTW